MPDCPELNRVLSCTSLPSLPNVGVQVLALTRNPNVGLDQIAKIIETDPALSAKVLKTVNSSVYGLKSPCTTIRRALNYLGLSAVKSIVLGFSLVDSTRGLEGGDGFDLNDHWRRAIYAGAAARVIAQKVGRCDPEEAFAAALFQDIGALAMFTALGVRYTHAVGVATHDHAAHPDLERAALGFTHCECGAALAAKWHMPERYVQIIRHHHEPDRAEPASRELVRIVGLGALMAGALMASQPATQLAALLAAGRQWFGMQPTELANVLGQVGKAAAELARLMDKHVGAPPDAAALMQQASEELVNQQIAAMREADQLRERNESLLQQTITDALTGIGNRKRFNDEAARLYAESRGISRPFALVMCDGDRFKSVNDTHGHHVGDGVLKELARRIRDAAGAAGIACRYGGEEFAVLLPGATSAEAIALAEAVRGAVAAPEFDLSAIPGAPPRLPITISLGVATCEPGGPDDYASIEQVIEAADKALYNAKHTGRNRVCADREAAGHAVAPSAQPAASAATPVAPAASPARQPVPDAVRPAMRAAGSPPAAPRPRAAAGATVLLLEDDPLAARMILAVMQRLPGVQVEWLRSAQKGMGRIADAANTPGRMLHAVVADYGLGGANGLSVLASARRHRSLAGLPFAIISSMEESLIGMECLEAGADVYITKDALLQQLPAWLTGVLSEAGLTAAA